MIPRIIFFYGASLFCASVIAVSAQSAPDVATNITKAYRQFLDIGTINITVPTVVEVPITQNFLERFDIALLNTTTGKFEPYHMMVTSKVKHISLSAEGPNGQIREITDGNTSTFADFQLPEDVQGSAQIVLRGTTAITSTSLSVLLDNYVALPKTIEIRTLNNGKEQILVAKSIMESQTVRFPKTTADTWIITLTYGQPLRIAELHLGQENMTSLHARSVRFLAQPSHEYRMYLDPDRYVMIPVGEAGNLSSNDNIRILSTFPLQQNSVYTIADTDGDGIADMRDNCVQTSNVDQEDIDENGRGDVCDDFDRDGHINLGDNCPLAPNRSQVDTDADGVGDICDSEESRITEKYAWLPWTGMGFAALVLIVLTISMLKQKKDV